VVPRSICRSGLSAYNVCASSPSPHRRVDAPPREQAGFSLLIRSPSPVRTGFRWALPVPGYGCPTPPPYQSAQVSGVAAPWAPGPGLPAFGRVGTSGRPRGGGLSPLPRHAHLTEASLGSPFPTRLRSSGRACGTRARAPRVPASPMGGRVAPLPLPLTRRAIGYPPVSPASQPKPGGGSPRVVPSPLTEAHAVACGAVCRGYSYPVARADSPLPTGGVFTHSQHGQPPGFRGLRPPRRPFPRRPSSKPPIPRGCRIGIDPDVSIARSPPLSAAPAPISGGTRLPRPPPPAATGVGFRAPAPPGFGPAQW